MKVAGKHILITGGGNGIGRELALQMAAKGARVTAVDRDPKALEETLKLATERNHKLYIKYADISVRKEVEALCLETISLHGPIDGLINNAGIIQPFVPFVALDYPHIEHVMAVNFWGTVHMIKSLLPQLLQRPEAHIMNVSSMGGFLPVPGQTLYGASKAAVKLLTEGLHAELADTNVRVTLVLPGAVDTDITLHSGLQKPAAIAKGSNTIPMMPVDQAAALMIEAMEKNRYRVLVGKDAKSMDLLYRLNPYRACQSIRKKMRGLLPSS